MAKCFPLSMDKENKCFDFALDDDNFEKSHPKSAVRFELLHPVPSKEWLNVIRFPQAKRGSRSTLDDLYWLPLLQTLRSA